MLQDIAELRETAASTVKDVRFLRRQLAQAATQIATLAELVRDAGESSRSDMAIKEQIESTIASRIAAVAGGLTREWQLRTNDIRQIVADQSERIAGIETAERYDQKLWMAG